MTRDENGDLNYSFIPTHQAKQIAGRAGRFGSGENVGLVTAHTEKKMIELKEIIQQDLEDIQVKTHREITLQRSLLMICSSPDGKLVEVLERERCPSIMAFMLPFIIFKMKLLDFIRHISTNKRNFLLYLRSEEAKLNDIIF